MERLEPRLVLSTITWLNDGQASDNFDAVFPSAADAEMAREVVRAAIDDWERTIVSFNHTDPNVTVLPYELGMTIRMVPGNAGCSANVQPGNVMISSEGKPFQATMRINLCDGDGDSTPDWFIDPTPNDHSEFLGTEADTSNNERDPGPLNNAMIPHAFAGVPQSSSPANNQFDLRTLVLHEMGHAVGMTSNSSSLFSTSPNISNTGVVDDATGGNNFWLYQSPTLNYVLTDLDSGNPNSDPRHAAIYRAGNTAIPGAPTVYGSRNLMNPTSVSFNKRQLIPNHFAQMLGEIYGYTMTVPASSGTFHALLNPNSGVLNIRGGNDAVSVDGVTVNNSSDVVTIAVDDDELVVSVDIGIDMPGLGTGMNPMDQQGAYVSRFDLDDVQTIVARGFGGDDTIAAINLPAEIALRIEGGDGNDVLQGDSGDDVIRGGAGNDQIVGRGGDDLIFAGSGDDMVAANDGDDVVFAGPGDDHVLGQQGHDKLHGNEGQDTLEGGPDDDLLVGGGDEDSLFGDAGSDQLIGGYQLVSGPIFVDASRDFLDGGADHDALAGDNANLTFGQFHVSFPVGGPDLILGGEGDDTIFGQTGDDQIQGNQGDDVIFGMSGDDLVFGGSIVCSAGDEPSPDQPPHDGPRQDRPRRDAESPGCFEVFQHPDQPRRPAPGGPNPSAADGSDYIDLGPGADTGYGDNWSAAARESTLGGSGDRIFGRSEEDLIYGQVGADVIDGNGGDDRLFGQFGNDDLRGGTGDDTVDGGAGADRLTGGDGDDVLRGRRGNDLLFGNEGDDTLDGGRDDDQLRGQAGDDHLLGRQGDDVLFGGLGADQLDGGSQDDNLRGGPGNDILFGGNGVDTLRGGLQDDLLSGDAGDDLLLGQRGNDILLGGPGRDVLRGGRGNDSLQGGTESDRLSGNAGDDLLAGGSGDDELDGGAGNDKLVGDGGSDTLRGGAGDDRLVGGGLVLSDSGGDALFGGPGKDVIRGDSGPLDSSHVNDPVGGSDTISGGPGDDVILAMAGNDIVEGNAGSDSIDGGDGRDFLRGNAGDDLIRGGDLDDTLIGDAGHDILLGEGGDDSLSGGAGRDILIGGRNRDALRGEAGDDILIGAFTHHDANDLALLAILREWTSGKSYPARVLNIMGINNSSFATRLNGNFFFIPSGDDQNMESDDANDQLFGGSGRDWFLPDPLDDILDDEDDEVISTVV